MNLLPAAAVFAGCKVAFIVAAHLQRQAGDVIPPARQNFPNDRIDAPLTHEQENKPNFATAGWVPTPLLVSPAALGSGTVRPGWPALFPLLSGLFPDGCSAQRDAPALQMPHCYHSRSSGNPRAHHSRDAPPGSSPAVLPTTDKALPAAFP